MTSSSAAATPYDILVVDDEPDLRTLYELTLLREGYRVEAAQDLREARAALEHKRFHAVITDMRLPDGLGIELLRELSAGQRPERAIVVTAHGSAENAGEALQCGGLPSPTKWHSARGPLDLSLPQCPFGDGFLPASGQSLPTGMIRVGGRLDTSDRKHTNKNRRNREIRSTAPTHRREGQRS